MGRFLGSSERRLGFVRLLIRAGVFASAAFAAAAQGVEPWGGVLESKGGYSAVFRVSTESGDLVGHLLRNDSPVGRKLLARCTPGMPCELEGVKLRAFDEARGNQLGFVDQPSGWAEIVAFESARVGSAIEEYRTRVPTAYGILAADEDQLTLLWQGKPLWPAGSGSFSVVRRYPSWGRGELLLVQNTGGTACPALYRLVEVSRQGVATSPEFGTCSDLVYPFVRNDASDKPQLVIRMVEHVGPFGVEVDRHRAARTLVEYQYSDGRLSRNGERGRAASGDAFR